MVIDSREIYRTVTECRVCGQPLVDEELFSLGDQLLALYTDEQIPLLRAPLDVMRCDACGLVQLHHSVYETVLYREYFYKSSMNRTMREHLLALARSVQLEAGLHPGDIVVDVGCNDGTLLEGYPVEGVIKVGYDLAANMMDEARARGSVVFNEAFSARAYNKVFTQRASVITAVAMFYDLNDPVSFLHSIKEVLAPEGLALIQMNDLYSMVKNNAFDMISHEHVCYYSMKVMHQLLGSCGLVIERFEHFDLNGGTVRLFVRHNDYPMWSWAPGEGRVEAAENGIQQQIAKEQPEIEKLDRFVQRIYWAAVMVRKFVEDEVKSGGKVYVYGASTRGNVILQAANLDGKLITGAAEINLDKIGKKISGLDIPIVSEEEARQKATAFLVLPYSYKAEFLERERAFLDAGGKMAFPLPNLEVVGG